MQQNPMSGSHTMQDEVTKIAQKIAEGGQNIVFTGAGISTESGIPDYRSKGGIWDKFRPVYFDEFMSEQKARAEYWRRWIQTYQSISQAQPNAAHRALAELYDFDLLEAVITQNIDGLHQDSGLPPEKVIELHGNTCRILCMKCRTVVSLDATCKRLAAGDSAPECESCGGYLKPDTISFGQTMPIEEVEKAVAFSQNSDFFMVVGSTLLVQPAAQMPIYAKNGNAFLAIVNLSQTPHDRLCDVRIQAKAGSTLTQITNCIRQIR